MYANAAKVGFDASLVKNASFKNVFVGVITNRIMKRTIRTSQCSVITQSGGKTRPMPNAFGTSPDLSVGNLFAQV